MAFKKGHQKEGGRKAGTPNKTTTTLKEAILKAAELAGDKLPGSEAGLVKYLQGQALANPQAFLSLLGRVLPIQNEHSGKDGEPIQHQISAAAEILRRLDAIAARKS